MPRWSPFREYFWSLVEKTEHGCWLWKGGKTTNGYGRVCFNGPRRPAHRVAWILSGHEIPAGMYLCHHCDVPLCVNPDHLFIGTQKDNMQDWTKKGKNRLVNDRSLWKTGDQHWTRTNPGAGAYLSEQIRKQFQSGRRESIRGEKGRIMGTRMVK